MKRLLYNHLRALMLLISCMSLLFAPVAQASIAEDELEDFARWPLYQECTLNISTTGSSGAGIQITGSSTFLHGDPLALRFPTINDEPAFAAAMEGFIRRVKPSSPWLDIPNLGTKLVAEGKIRQVNPMMIVVIGRAETQWGSDGGASSQANNSFGNKGNGPNGYRVWPSIEASLFGDDSFTKAVQDRIEGKHPSYSGVKNMYEYLSVHLTGKILYPGDPRKSFDDLMKVQLSSSNVEKYFNNATTWIGEMTGLTITGIPNPTGGVNTAGIDECTGAVSSSQQGSGIVNPDGYAFPLFPQTKRSYSTLPCTPANYYPPGSNSGTCHHDVTPAFDLMYGSNAEMSGKAVYAISDGTIARRQVYREIQGCYIIEIKSSKDNLYYWYGHLQNPNMSLAVGGPVRAGDLIAEVARTELGPRCHGRDAGAQPAPHLHIDRGCTLGGVPQHGGGKSCRDWSFIPFMNKMWDGLPESRPGNPSLPRPTEVF